jgi:hypothetical protein
MTLNRILAGLVVALGMAVFPSTAKAQTWGYVPSTTSYYVNPATGAVTGYQVPAQGVPVYGPGMYYSYSPFYYAPSAVYSYGPAYYSVGTPVYSYTYPGYTTYYRTYRWVR